MPQSVNLAADEEYDLGPVSGLRGGNPAPLADPVVFEPSGPIELVVIDPVTVTVKASGAGPYSVTVSSGSLPAEVVSGEVSALNADSLVVPVGPVRKQA